MKPINIFALTRLSDIENLKRLEKQMSGRRHLLLIKEWEIDGMRQFIEELIKVVPEAVAYEFYYSFQLPKLGKEFDLLRISEDYVLNVELKSGNVSDEAIRKQLLQNRHYLAMLGKMTYSYTYISNQNRLVRLSKSGKLVETGWEKLREDCQKQKNCMNGQIEELFKEDKYLISPLAEPDKFLRQEYFLTYQQRDIRKQILAKVSQKENSCLCFTGLPGTGKTLLLYDIAMQLSWKEKVCILHFGTWSDEIEQLNQRLKRIDFINCVGDGEIKFQGDYSAICVDEGHYIKKQDMERIMSFSGKKKIPVIVSYDSEDAIAQSERSSSGGVVIEKLENYTRFRLTNRIRVNSEISSFINSLMHAQRENHREYYPSVGVVCANDWNEAFIFLQNYIQAGYVFIKDERICIEERRQQQENVTTQVVGASEIASICMPEAACKDFERVVMVIDESFSYTEDGYLVADGEAKGQSSKVRGLFHGLNRAKEQVALVVVKNRQVFERILRILQR